MSREIKFRAWDKKLKEMFDWKQIDGLDTDGVLPFLDMIKFQSVEVMQYTGLKDKNGKEIYEGDVLRTKIAGDIYHDVAKWSDANAGWIFESAHGADTVQWADLEDGKPEVIGNIYEHPHLLKEADAT